MKPIDEDLLNEIDPLDDAVLDDLATALTAAAAVAQELKSDWQPRQMEATLHSLEDAIKRAWGALSRAESHARSARTAADRCGECGSPLEYDANGSRWCPNTDCELGQIASRHRLLIEFLAEPPTEEIRELCRAYWRQDESCSLVYRNVNDVAEQFGDSGPMKVTFTVKRYCRAYTLQRCKDCGEPIGRYQSRSEYMHEHNPRATRCPHCAGD